MLFPTPRLLFSCLLFSNVLSCGNLNPTLEVNPLVAPIRLSGEEKIRYPNLFFGKTSYLVIAPEADDRILGTLSHLAAIYFPSQTRIESNKKKQLGLEQEEQALLKAISADESLDKQIEDLKGLLKTAKKNHKVIKSQIDACNREKAKRAGEALALQSKVTEIRSLFTKLQDENEALERENQIELKQFLDEGGHIELQPPESLSLSFDDQKLVHAQLVWKKYAPEPLLPMTECFKASKGDLYLRFATQMYWIELKINLHPKLESTMPKYLGRLDVSSRLEDTSEKSMGFLYLQP